MRIALKFRIVSVDQRDSRIDLAAIIVLLALQVTNSHSIKFSHARRIDVTYWRYWQFDAAPFTGDSDQPLFRGATVEEAVARLEFLISNRRHVGSIVGASGVGKSTLLRHTAMVPPRTEQVPNLSITKVSVLGMGPGELITLLASRFAGGRSPADSPAAWSCLCDYFSAARREDVHSVLLVDDTESCSAAAEADLCRLLSMEFPLTLVFTVESQMVSAVGRPLLERTDLQIDLPGWDVSQTAEFLAWTGHRLGRNEPIFTDRAIERIQQLSEGITRRIVQIADLSLVAGAVAQSDCVDVDCIEQVAWELPKSSAA